MKTFQQFDEGLGTLAKVAVKGAVKFAKKGGLKKVAKLLKKKPRRTIDPFFANKAVERGTMVRGFHGQSVKNITQYKKTGVPPTVSGLNPSTSGYNKATQDWMKRSSYKPKTNMARPGKDAYFATATETGKKQAGKYARRGANYENEKLKNQLNPFKKKDKGAVMDVVVNKKSIRKGWKKLQTPGTETERIAKAQDIIPVVPGPSAKIAKYRLNKLKRTKHQRLKENKTFKQFLEEASDALNKVINVRQDGWRFRNMFGPGGRYKKLEPIPKPKQAKLKKDDKINSQYKDITNPKKPSEFDLIKGTTKKA